MRTCNFIHNSQKLEVDQVFISERMHRQTGVDMKQSTTQIKGSKALTPATTWLNLIVLTERNLTPKNADSTSAFS